MNVGEVLVFALRALAGHRLRSSLSLLGVTIGIAAVLLLTALGDGARRYVVEQFTDIGSNLVIVVPGKNETTGMVPGVTGVPNDLTLEDAVAVERGVADVVAVAPISIATETVSSFDRRRQVAVVGTTPSFFEIRQLRLSQGERLPAGELSRGSPVVILGAKTARELFPAAQPLGKVVRIGGWRMRVIGVVEAKGTQLGVDVDDVAIVPVATAMKMFDRTSLFRVLCQVRTHSDLERAKGRILALLIERHGEEDVTCLTQDAVVATFSSILAALTLAVSAIAAISLSVAGLGIMNVMLVTVSERTREVGLLKAIGAQRRQIVSIFLAEAAFLAIAGGLLGVLVGHGAVAVLVRVYPALPARPPLWAVAGGLGLSLAVGLLFGVLPARRASRLEPVEALGRS